MTPEHTPATPSPPDDAPAELTALGAAPVLSTPVVDLSRTYQGGFTTPRRSTDLLIAHHAAAHYKQATGPQDVAAIADWHIRGNRWSGIGYQEILAEETNGGRIVAYLVSDPSTQRAHIALQNDIAFGICCATDFGDTIPAQKWIDALADRLAVAQRRWPQARIAGHKDVARPGYETTCPGTRWHEWRPRLLAAVRERLQPTTTTTPLQVIGVPPSIRLATFLAVCRDHRAPFDPPYFETIASRIYTLAAWLDIDPAFFLAVWLHEQGSPLGGSEVGRLTLGPLNVKAYDQRAVLPPGERPRWPRLQIGAAWWQAYESWQLGCFHALMHLKQIYGARGLLTVEAIVPEFAPAGDGNAPSSYIAAVRRDMAAMRARETR